MSENQDSMDWMYDPSDHAAPSAASSSLPPAASEVGGAHSAPEFQWAPGLVGGKPRLFIEYDVPSGRFRVIPSVVQLFREEIVKEPIHIIAIAGPARTGKSFVMNRLFETSGEYQPGGFELGDETRPCTHGIWVWVRRIDGKLFVLIDTEGLKAVEKHTSADFDNKVLTLAVLLCSTFVWNNISVIDRVGLQALGFIAQVTRMVKFRSEATEDMSDAAQKAQVDVRLNEFFPKFVWLVRDFTLNPVHPRTGLPLSDDDYLKCQLESTSDMEISRGVKTYFRDLHAFTLVVPVFGEEQLRRVEENANLVRPKFTAKLDQVVEHLRSNTTPRRTNGTLWSGELFATMAEAFVAEINSKQFVHVDESFESAQGNVNHSLIRLYSHQYVEQMETAWEAAPKPLSRRDLFALHRSVFLPMYKEFLTRVIIVETDFTHADSEAVDVSFVVTPPESGQEEVVNLCASEDVTRVDRWSARLFRFIEGVNEDGEFHVFVDRNRNLSRRCCLEFLEQQWSLIDQNIAGKQRYFPVDGVSNDGEALMQFLYDDRATILAAYDQNHGLGDSCVKAEVRENFLKTKESQIQTVKTAVATIVKNIEIIVEQKKKTEEAVIASADALEAKQRAVVDLQHAHVEHAQRISDLQADQERRIAEVIELNEEQLRDQKAELTALAEKQLGEMEQKTQKTVEELQRKIRKTKKKAKRQATEAQRTLQRMNSQLGELRNKASQPVIVRTGGGGMCSVM